MKDPVEKILKLIGEKKITARDAEKLLESLEENIDKLPLVLQRETATRRLELVESEDKPGYSCFEFDPGKEIYIDLPLQDVEVQGEETGENRLLFSNNVDKVTVWEEELSYCIHLTKKEKNNDKFKILVCSAEKSNLVVNGVNGDVKIDGVNGDIKLKNKTGDIFISNIHEARLVLNCIDSDINIKDCVSNLEIKTTDGDVLIEDCEVEGSIYSISGDIEVKASGVDLVVDCYSADSRIEEVTGNIKWKSTSGNLQISDFQGKLAAYSRAGDIMMKKSSGIIKATSVSGDTKADEITVEKLQIDTSSGNINVKPDYLEESAELKLKTRSGNILVILPEKTGGTINACSKSGKVVCNRKLEEKLSEGDNCISWTLSDNQNVDPPVVELESILGNIEIK
ncbi:MAG: DUF4097 family beta strand repeat-containing protein [Vulcanimicrobiota bacterium]